MHYIKQGLGSAKRQIAVAILLFLYQLLWGVFLYRIVDSVIAPALRRYPESEVGQLSRLLYLIEGQHELQTSSDVKLVLGLIAGMFLFRLILTPLIRAGIYNGLLGEADEEGAGWLFFQGMRKCWKPVAILYAIELLLILIPSIWLLPELYSLLPGLLQGTTGAMLKFGVILASLGIWSYLVKQGLLYVTFGWLSQTGIAPSLMQYVRKLPAVLAVSCILGAAALLAAGMFSTAAWIWTGLIGLILQQSYPFIRSFFRIWSVSSQYHLWKKSYQKN
ncbi:hypothetical protein DCC85_00495 [Paenibacillus sp. CAA11]|uniref:hypothetical protein n=1 Tax=Paenibacillus sp. CAA11 TaxID=1532905 RepID=UPI000D3B9280|nr:hypothetical protein [Paenibacillus sp. CAA11]AWB42864.1 hypothetical protein DCC85_00495 [Paenibacillus sp. CAA11]